ncbi:MAG: hypothetical protein AAB263_12525, partial [Planctomycetota bacterium]
CTLTLDLLAAWPAKPIAAVRKQLRPGVPLILVAEGSSQLMPGAFLRSCARTWNWTTQVDALGGRAFAALPSGQRAVIAISNSGRSREVVEAMSRFPADATALVGIPGGNLTKLPHHILLPRPEVAVPATASVFGTCLALGHALADACGQPVPVADLLAATKQQLAAPEITAVGNVKRVFWLGGHAGATAELALKTMEMTGLAGFDMPGSLGLHGIHEVLAPGDLVVALDIHADDIGELRRRVEVQCGSRLHAPTLPNLGVWSPLIALVHGWRVLATVAAALGRDPAKPARATKLGNPALG